MFCLILPVEKVPWWFLGVQFILFIKVQIIEIGIELGSGKLYPNYPHSLGMFQAKAIGSVNDGALEEDICLHQFVLRGVDH